MTKKKWQKKAGFNFVNKIGLKSGDSILDFGCGEGLFTIPAAKKVGPEGHIIAFDIDADNLKTLNKKIEDQALNNIELVHSDGDLEMEFEDQCFDMVFLYDVIHLFDKQQRNKLFDEFHRILKKKGRLSIYPKHTADNFPMHELRHTYVDEVVKEVECHAFALDRKMKIKILHDERIQEDDIYNFKKLKR